VKPGQEKIYGIDDRHKTAAEWVSPLFTKAAQSEKINGNWIPSGAKLKL
jgi:hypothetical protein